ncbi:MAG: amidohydrolase, partial [Betaproteobacteria bacterium]|nr:amidohydrolase [Betaproteobacteria bacterium]
FQPAEEGLGGALAMINEGLFERFPCDSIFGMHNRPKLPVGHFNVKAGPMMASAASWDIHIQGYGSHGARPESSVDPILIGAQIVSNLQAIVSRNVRPVETAVVSVCQFHSGDAYNVIPQTARLAGTARAFSSDIMTLIETNMKRIASGIAAAHGASVDVDFRNIFSPVINDPAEAEFAASVCTTKSLFSGLKNKVDGAVEAFACCQILCSAKQHRGVTVMAAGMHQSLASRTMGELVQFQDRQSIHIGA